jgi:hypothetical protein
MKKQLIFEFEDGSAKSTGQRWDSMTTNFYTGDEVLQVFGGETLCHSFQVTARG